MSAPRLADCATGFHDRCLHPERCGCPCHAKAGRAELVQTPADGHTWHLTVASRGSYPVMEGEDTTPHDYADADWLGEPWTMEVRAWSLPAALKLAAEQPLGAWVRPNGKRLDDEQ